jgi:hypothetical protein
MKSNNTGAPIVVYSHTDYIDVLNVQNYYLSSYSEKILLINDSIENTRLDKLNTLYKQIITYNDQLPYASRLLALDELNYDYIILLHDMDILIKQDINAINHLYSLARRDSIDRIDLQSNLNYTTDKADNINISINNHNFSLFRATSPGSYVYNVNPSIWNLNTLCNTMRMYSNETYRSIENSAIQTTCSELLVYKIHGNTQLVCGYYCCHPFFQFLHLTHGGKYLPKVETNFVNELRDEYQFICNNLLQDTTREFNLHR